MQRRMKRLKFKNFIAFVLAFCLVISQCTITAKATSSEIKASGTCGPNINWTLDNDGLLNIEGQGDMGNIDSCGWIDYIRDIKSVIINDGVTSISEGIFAYCSNMSIINIADSVQRIENNAFSMCKSLKEIIIPDSVTEMGMEMFFKCNSLEKVTLSSGLTKINNGKNGSSRY